MNLFGYLGLFAFWEEVYLKEMCLYNSHFPPLCKKSHILYECDIQENHDNNIGSKLFYRISFVVVS